ncbi:DUF4838 domain-containing protein [Cohnella silvisoli]|uniref:DUF4838 domain-containing protein n=1 Tax=Cohnella silvisoli TaxID=2873699 RepID=A0ABV1KU53_9BACL|nr:DUF4838 domain-containing protein [Cohnella silvisoli]MCD9023241.1 DUF4838 domain-containing protein [Cohnella silvisoli]
MIIIKQGAACASIVVEQTPVALFAAKELQKYLLRISGCRVSVSGKRVDGHAAIYIGSMHWCKNETHYDPGFEQLKDDGFCIKSVNNELILSSRAERGLLFAVYSLLEMIGCRWFYPGESGEFIPSLHDIRIDDLSVLENPDFAIRSFTEDSHQEPSDIWKMEITELIDWCCKNKINAIFIHSHPLKEIEGIEFVKGEIKKRGMLYEHGGHGVQDLIDRNLFEQKPYLFREKNGERRRDGNFCGSCDETIEMLVSGLEEVLKKHPEIDLLHLFFDDVMEGSWCECERCKAISPAQQLMNVINRIAGRIAIIAPEVKIDMVLYHDTLDMAQITSAPENNVIGYFAPRERCYSHSIGDSSCERNAVYLQKLKDVVGKFGENSYVFEYYDDMILFRKMKINIPSVIAQDLKDYRKAGIGKITSLMFGRYSWWAYEFNMHVFVKAAWNTNYDYSQGLREFCSKLFPGIAEQMILYYNRLEQASYGFLTFCEYEGFVQDLRNLPPQNYDFYQKHIEQIKKSIELLNSGMFVIKELMKNSGDEQQIRLIREKYILDITIMEAEAIYHEMLGRFLYEKGGYADNDLLETHLQIAKSLISETKNRIEKIPYSIKGIAGGDGIFVRHLCGDQIHFLDSIQKLPNPSDAGQLGK